MASRRTVLLVDDNEDHRFFTRRALRTIPLAAPGAPPPVYDVHEVGDGDEALRFLERQGTHRDSPRPDLILLDLKMPRLDGFSVLEALRAHEDLSSIPVIVLTTSAHDQDVERARRLGARGYVIKPLDTGLLAEALQGAFGDACGPPSTEAKS